MKKQKHYRQGDVLIELIREIPSTAAKQKKQDRIILAHGEVTGHHHELHADSADWWKLGDIPSTNEKPSRLVGEIFLNLKKPCEVKHPEHATITLPKGNYRVTRQREYYPESIRTVAD